MPKQYYTVKDYQSRRSIGYLLRRSGKLITNRIEKLFVEEDISFVQWVILMNLRDGLHVTATELSQHLCELIGRVVALDLTDEGRKATESFLPRVVGLYNGLVSDFTKAETDQLISLLTRLIAKLSEPAEG